MQRQIETQRWDKQLEKLFLALALKKSGMLQIVSRGIFKLLEQLLKQNQVNSLGFKNIGLLR